MDALRKRMRRQAVKVVAVLGCMGVVLLILGALMLRAYFGPEGAGIHLGGGLLCLAGGVLFAGVGVYTLLKSGGKGGLSEIEEFCAASQTPAKTRQSIEAALQNAHEIGGVFFSPDYIVAAVGGQAAITTPGRLVWAYLKVQKTYGLTTSAHLYLCLSDENILTPQMQRAEVDAALQYIQTAYPHVEVGYSDERFRRYQRSPHTFPIEGQEQPKP